MSSGPCSSHYTLLYSPLGKEYAVSVREKGFSCSVPVLALQAIQKLLLQTFVLCDLCYKGPFVTPPAFRTLLSAKVTFNLSEVPLVYRRPNYSVTVFLAKKISKRRSLGTQLECESAFFLSFFLSFFFFLLVFGIPYFQKQLPSYPMAVMFACSAFSVPK